MPDYSEKDGAMGIRTRSTKLNRPQRKGSTNLDPPERDEETVTLLGDPAGEGQQPGADPAPGAGADPARDRLADPGRDPGTDPARDRFGGVNPGAALFGWLVAVGVTVLLTGVIGAVAAALGTGTGLTREDAGLSGGSAGLAAAVVLGVVLALGYYAGGYVAGRMSRFDGGRQGFLVWVLGTVLGIIAAAAGWVFGDAVNVLARVDLPSMPVPAGALSLGTVVAGLVVLVVTGLVATLGGKVGCRYHRKVDAARSG